MSKPEFIVVGENIHCTRIFKVGGKYVKSGNDGHFIEYKSGADSRRLPIPEEFTGSGDWEAGKVKHCSVAIWQGNRGDSKAKEAGIDYLRTVAARQEADGANYLDVNVDEYSTDVEERIRAMKWTAGIVQEAVSIPLSIDSSNVDVLRAGLEVCDTSRGKPMVNSVSLERADAVKLSAEFGAVVIASAAGEKGLPATTAEKMGNIERLVPMLEAEGFTLADMHVDPLVLPISVDGENGKRFLEAVSAVRKKYGPEIHIVAGLSNVSFGMPRRKLINQVFSYLAVQAGADGGIVDPAQINGDILASLDTGSKAFKLAQDLLTGKDEFGMNYITATRDGTI